MTELELCESALRLVKALKVGQQIGASARAECRRTANALLTAWSIERLMVYQIAEATYAWPSGTASRTIGPSGADFTAARPTRVETAVIVDGDERHPLEVIRSQDRWAGISQRTLTSELPELLHDNMASPVSTLFLWRVPSKALTLELGVWAELTAFTADLAAQIALPPGYERALLYNLALEFAPKFEGAEVSELVARTAPESKAAIKRVNMPVPLMECDSGVGAGRGYYDIRTGGYRR
jgi:hypothetical protein